MGIRIFLDSPIGVSSDQGCLRLTKSRWESVAGGTYRWAGNSEIKLNYWYVVPITFTLMVLAMPTLIQGLMKKIRSNTNRTN